MDVSPIMSRLADGLAEAQHSRIGKSNKSGRRDAAQLPPVPCKFSLAFRRRIAKPGQSIYKRRHRDSKRGGICMISIDAQIAASRPMSMLDARLVF
jgi:hypothetical protein